MTLISLFKSTVVCASMALFSVGGASAATLSFDGAFTGVATSYSDQGFTFTPVRIVNGNCGIANPCLALNNNQTTTITRDGGGTFSLLSFWFELLGEGSKNDGTNTLTVTGQAPTFAIDYTSLTDGHNDGGQTATFLSQFANVTSIIFSHHGGGNARIDELVLVPTPTPPAPVPLPAGAGLLAMALGGMALASRRKKA